MDYQTIDPERAGWPDFSLLKSFVVKKESVKRYKRKTSQLFSDTSLSKKTSVANKVIEG